MENIVRDLQFPFDKKHIEWRIQRSGKNEKTGKVWAFVLAYVTARAIMDRLDDTVGPGNWRDEYVHKPSGVLCGLSLKMGGEWVTKWDGAAETDVEAFKGGISSALKRAAVKWGIGRYLYDLEEGFAQCSTDKEGDGWHYAKLKDKTPFYWREPELPEWATPAGVLKEERAAAFKALCDFIKAFTERGGDGERADRLSTALEFLGMKDKGEIAKLETESMVNLLSDMKNSARFVD